MHDFSNKTYLVTGASSGIGREIARELAHSGAHIWINYFSSDTGASQIAEEIAATGGKASIVQADVSQETEVQSMFQKIEERSSQLDGVVNNAGIDRNHLLEKFDLEDWNRVVAVNLTGKFLVTKHAVPLLKRSKAPRIVNIASRLCITPLPTGSAYACATSGIVSLTKSTALELSKFNIRANVVCAGFTKTPLTERIYPDQQVWNIRAEANPSKRVGLPRDIARATAFLLSDEADYINGSQLFVDGGSTLVGGGTLKV